MRHWLVPLLSLIAVGCHDPAPPLAGTATTAPSAASAALTAAPMNASAAPPPATAAGAGSPGAAEIAWASDPGPPSPRADRALAIVGKDDLIDVEVDQAKRESVVQRVRFHRNVVWQRPLPSEPVGAAALLVDAAGQRVYVTLYSPISSGATVHGLELDTGKELWSRPVHGLGPISHSKYQNHVTLALVGGALVVFGNETQGRYIEAFDPASGRMLSTRTLPAARN